MLHFVVNLRDGGPGLLLKITPDRLEMPVLDIFSSFPETFLIGMINDESTDGKEKVYAKEIR